MSTATVFHKKTTKFWKFFFISCSVYIVHSTHTPDFSFVYRLPTGCRDVNGSYGIGTGTKWPDT